MDLILSVPELSNLFTGFVVFSLFCKFLNHKNININLMSLNVFSVSK